MNPKADISYTTTLVGSQPIINLDFSACPHCDLLWPCSRGCWSCRMTNSLLCVRVSTTTRASTVVNGSKQTLEVPGKNVREIFDDVDFYCSQIETEYEEQGKTIE